MFSIALGGFEDIIHHFVLIKLSLIDLDAEMQTGRKRAIAA
jgi:hypothetical protein